ncbi:UTP--glucose-1-phosphate uridylyltransferase [subsurface metagenome]
MSNEKEKINSIKIASTASILAALKQMDKTYKRLLLVFDGNQFVNVLSIGDIQRAIIKNYSLDIEISKILRKETKVSKSSESFETIKQQMLEYRTECMPVLNKEQELVDVYFWEDVFPVEQKRVERNLNLPVVILAGGKGTRLKPLTNVLPKPLIPIGEKTIIEHIMNHFVDVGCDNFFFSLNYKAEMIRFYFEQLKDHGYQINYIQEDKPLGTAGSLHLLKGKILSAFFVSNCDIIIDQDYGEIYDYHVKNKNEITIVAALKHYDIPYGTVDTIENGQLTSFNEKPELTFMINSGMYLLESHLLNEIPENEFFHITQLIESIQKRKGKVGVFPVSEHSWRDIGDWDEYLKNVSK